MNASLTKDRSPRHVRSFLLSLAALFALATAAGCGEQPAAPAAPGDASALAAAPPTGSALFHRDGGRLHRNRDRYRDHGHSHHATGRSGSAQIQAVAVLYPDGTTRLTVTTGDLDEPASAKGYLSKVQVKLSPDACKGGEGGNRRGHGSRGRGNGHDDDRDDDDDDCARTLNFNGLTQPTVTLPIPGVERGDILRVQANVRGIDGRRTDVVTLSVEVVLAPSVQVDIQVPPKVVVGTPTLVTATVTEVAGDLGSGGNCELYANGVLVDRATGIWVDAGDAVTCAFTYTPSQSGSQNLEVRLADPDGGSLGGVPSDHATVDVTPANATAYAATAEDKSVETSTRLEYHWEKLDGSHKEYDKTETETRRTQTVQVAATLTRPAVFPLAAASLRFESNGVVWHEQAWTGLAGAPNGQGQTCATQQMPEQGAVFYVCGNGVSSTFGYTRFGGTVTYHATGFVNTFDGVGGQGDYFTFNDNYTTWSQGGQNRAWGSTVTVRLSVTDAQGTFTVQPVVPLSPFSSNSVTAPRACELIYHYWLEGNAQEQCTSAWTHEFGVRGGTQG